MASFLDRFLLTDRVALVTGAGRGIGAATALAFADAGADVALTSRTAAQLEEIAEEVKAKGRRALVLPADVDDVSLHSDLVARTVSEFGRLDVLVNNVGGSFPRPFLETSTRMFEKAFHFNVTTAFELTKAATPHLLDSGAGSVINITSFIGHGINRGSAAYGTAKAGLAHLTRLLAADLAPRVRVNAVAPGSIATAALDTVLTDEIRDVMIANTPLRRLGDPEDIAAAVLYLAAPSGSYLTGKVIEVDGGIQVSNLPSGLDDL
jgi:7-alpha-hydroxysteroid dehydrogenase